jgi:hypothetical protein
VIYVVAPHTLPSDAMAEGTGGEGLSVPEDFIRKGDDHAPLTGSQCIEGEEELVFPEFAQPRRK